MVHLKIDYVELQSPDLALTKEFFTKAFEWTFKDYGPGYAEISNGGVDGGISAPDEPVKPSLIILKADDLEAAQKAVESAGGEIVAPIYSFPGGRRFHFLEPGGNEMAVWSEA